MEDTRSDGSVLFLVTILTPEHNRTLYTGNPPIETNTHIDIASNIQEPNIVINALIHRDKVVCSTPELLRTEKQHLREVLTKFRYPMWV